MLLTGARTSNVATWWCSDRSHRRRLVGLAVVETDDEQALRDFAAQDPVVTTGTAAFELGRMAAGHVRGR
jgi:hypothetical protein